MVALADQSRGTVAMLHYAGPPGIGGVEATIAAHAHVFAADGWQVRVLAGSGSAPTPSIDLRINPAFGSRGAPLETINRELAVGICSAAFADLVDQTHQHLVAALAGVTVLIVHNVLTLHKNLALTSALWRMHQNHQLPTTLVWAHDFAWLDPLYQPELHAGEPWELLRRPWPNVRYVVVSPDRRGMLAELFGIPEGDIAVVTPGVDLATLLKLEPTTVALVEQLNLLAYWPLLLLPARITRRKNIELAIQIVAGLRQQLLDPCLIISGPPGPHNPTNAAYLADLQALRHTSGTKDAVIFLYETLTDDHGQPQPVSDAMLADLFRLSDGLLFPSRSEGFGMPIIEAGLVGLPIFCSSIAPFRETANTAANYFDLNADPATIAKMIATTLAADQRALFRRQVRQEYTWDALYRRAILPMLEGYD
jgi:glycosyltransferase involved in cell wall biosynthesis